MRLHYTVSEDDYLEFNIYHARHAPNYARTLISLSLLAPVIIIALTAAAMTFFTIPAYVWGVLASAACLYWVVTVQRRFENIIKRHVRKLTGKINEFTGDYVLETHENGLTYEGNGERSEIAYSRVNKVAADRGRLYILLGALSAIIVPESAFAGPEQRREFLDILRLKCPEAAVPAAATK